MKPEAPHIPPAAQEPTRSAEPSPYEPPGILWEHEFVALLGISPPPCIPGVDPQCTGRPPPGRG